MKNQLRMPGCLLAASVLVMALAGCGHRLDGQQASGFVEPVKTYEQRHPIEIEKARAVLALSVPANAHGLNVYQKERVRHFIALWRNEGAGKIAIAGNNREALGDLRDLLIERVVPVGAVQVIGYDAGQPGLKLSFARYVAEGPKCGKFPTNLAIDPGNTEYENFGCAGQHNFAAMLREAHIAPGSSRERKVGRQVTDRSRGSCGRPRQRQQQRHGARASDMADHQQLLEAAPHNLGSI